MLKYILVLQHSFREVFFFKFFKALPKALYLHCLIRFHHFCIIPFVRYFFNMLSLFTLLFFYKKWKKGKKKIPLTWITHLFTIYHWSTTLLEESWYYFQSFASDSILNGKVLLRYRTRCVKTLTGSYQTLMAWEDNIKYYFCILSVPILLN